MLNAASVREGGDADVGHQVIEALNNELGVNVIVDSGGTSTVKSRYDVYQWLENQVREVIQLRNPLRSTRCFASRWHYSARA